MLCDDVLTLSSFTVTAMTSAEITVAQAIVLYALANQRIISMRR